MFWKKQKQIEKLVLKHLAEVEDSLSRFQESLAAYLAGDVEKAGELALATHTAEGRADDTRREVETALLGGALLAPSRRDILEIIEQVDKLANAGEEILDYLLLQRVTIPSDLKPFIEQIAAKTNEMIGEVHSAMHMLFENMNKALEHTKKIEVKESDVDRIEREAIKAVFKMDIGLAEKMQLFGLIEELVEVSDRGEDLSDRIDMMVAQRRL
ncbi:MAG TPA: DUF47 domain-containing protein [Candidatus Acetothermia bacterium]|nr:DUF47 domain-containing protein [Candidatus Acetothermia bacterium]